MGSVAEAEYVDQVLYVPDDVTPQTWRDALVVGMQCLGHDVKIAALEKDLFRWGMGVYVCHATCDVCHEFVVLHRKGAVGAIFDKPCRGYPRRLRVDTTTP